LQIRDRYETYNTALAAWLYLNGISYNHIDIENGRNNNGDSSRVAIFVYTHSDKLDLLVEQYRNGLATGNIPAYFDCYKNLLRKVKEAMRS
jgi:hypothetical protein